MKKIHFKLGILCLILSIQGCATNDSNSPLVRFWNDGFVYSEKKEKIGNECSEEASNAKAIKKINDDEWGTIVYECMKKKGY